MTRTIKLAIEYDGTEYSGFQRQTKSRTIQGTLEDTLRKILKSSVAVIGAGRTDAGVHALGQVCHFKTTSSLPTENLIKALNTELPRDIVIHEAREMPPDFHARYSAKTRTYAYFLLNAPTPSALFHRLLHWIPFKLDDRAMADACAYLEGEMDFSSFLKSGSSRDNFIVTVREARCFRGTRRLRVPFSHLGNDVITFYIKADSFLYTMVRSIMGTLLQIGKKKRDPGDMHKILRRRRHGFAGPTAPPKGLFLVQVDYPMKYQGLSDV